MRAASSFAIALTLLGSFATTRAGSVVLNNLDQPPQPTGSSPFVGQSFIAGATQTLHGAQMQLDPTAPPSSSLTLEVEARNADGTVGQTLFSDFSSSYSTRSGLVTFLADAPFDFAANTGYWLVLSDPTKGRVTWDFTASQVYQSDLGYGLPSYNTAYYSDKDNGLGLASYYQPSDGPQMFDLTTVPVVAVGEPGSIVMLGLGIAIVLLAIGFHGARSAGLSQARVGTCQRTVQP